MFHAAGRCTRRAARTKRNVTCNSHGMANEPHFKDAEEREIARGGKAAAIWTLSLVVLLIAGGVALTLVLRQYVSPPTRPGTTSATTTAGEAALTTWRRSSASSASC